ncbi:MAG: UDP-N-acetylmuramate dehydrogenase [Clostridia bacterium]|nr:UDP-N-acetylmuramate dehydrogenase [Clostridia bacterium]
MDKIICFFESELSEIKSERNVPLSSLSTFKIGGPADIAVYPESRAELISSLQAAKKSGIRYTVIGNGSNILFHDRGYRGAVIVTGRIRDVGVDGNIITADPGVPFTALAARAAAEGLSGLEFAYGIPGCVGGAVVMNAGAYGGAVSDVLLSSDYYDTVRDETVTISHGDHGYGYRKSVYMDCPERVVLGAVFSLTYSDSDSVRAKNEENMNARRSKQPLEYPSAGSVFKRPEGYFVGKMVEDLGLKGFSVGGAQISEKHGGFIINRGGATAEDVLKLIRYTEEKVYREYRVELECEIRYIPDK